MQPWKNKSLKNIVKIINGIIYTERWKPIKGFEHNYLISTFGRIKSLKGSTSNPGPIIIYQRRCRRGYLLASIYKDRKEKKALVHRLVGIAFIRNPQKLPQINHKKGIQTDNFFKSLEWSNNSKNHKHAYDVLGRIPPRLGKSGKLHGKSKPVRQLSLNGKIIATHESINLAATFLNTSPGNIVGMLKGRHKSACGFKWEYVK